MTSIDHTGGMVKLTSHDHTDENGIKTSYDLTAGNCRKDQPRSRSWEW